MGCGCVTGTYLGKGCATGFVRFCFVAAFTFEPALDACGLGVAARRGFRAGVFALDLTTCLRPVAFLDAAVFLGAFFMRTMGLDNLDLVRSAGLDDFAFALSGGLESFALVRIAGLDDLALARSGGLAGLALARTAGLATFAFARTSCLEIFTLVRTTSFGDFVNFFVLTLVTPAPLDFVAFRAGAFVASERLTINFGRADLPDNVRLLAEGVAALRREAGVDRDRFTPLIVGSLMRSSRLSKKVTQKL